MQMAAAPTTCHQDLCWREGAPIVESPRVSISQLCRTQLFALYMYEVAGEQKQREVLSSHGVVWCLLGSRILRMKEVLNPCYNPMVPVDSLELSNGKKEEWTMQRGLTLFSCISLGTYYYLDQWRSGILAHPKQYSFLRALQVFIEAEFKRESKNKPLQEKPTAQKQKEKENKSWHGRSHMFF